MKKILMTVAMMGIAGGGYAAEFSELSVKASELKASVAIGAGNENVPVQAAGAAAKVHISKDCAAAAGIKLEFPPLSGAYNVGKVDIVFRDSSRTEVQATDSGCSFPDAWRSIPTIIYYPVEKSYSQGIRSLYLPEKVIRSLPVGKDMQDAMVGTKQRAFANAPLAGSAGKYPVILFSPGGEISSMFYAAILEDLASNGYIVAALSHPYLSGSVYLPDQDCLIGMEDVLMDPDKAVPYLNVAIPEAVKDLRYVFTALKDKRSSNGRFSNQIDFSRFFVMGHSAGGMAATMYCGNRGNGCNAGINLDGGKLTGKDVEVSGSWPKRRDLPFMKIHSGGIAPIDVIPKNYFGKRQYVVNIHRISHASFEDIAFLGPGLVPPPPGGTLIDPFASHKIIMGHVLGFLSSIGADSDKVEWPQLGESLGQEYEIQEKRW